MALIDATEIKPEIKEMVGDRRNSTEELKEIISQILNREPTKEKLAWSFGGIKVSN